MTLVSLIALCTITIFCLIQYPTNGTIPCSLDFWVYAIFLPFSIVTTLVKAARLLFLYRAHERAAMLIKSPSIDSNHQATSSVASGRRFLAQAAENWRYINDVISGKEQKRPAELTSFFSRLCSYLLAFHVIMTFAVYMADPSIGDRVVSCHSGMPPRCSTLLHKLKADQDNRMAMDPTPGCHPYLHLCVRPHYPLCLARYSRLATHEAGNANHGVRLHDQRAFVHCCPSL